MGMFTFIICERDMPLTGMGVMHSYIFSACGKLFFEVEKKPLTFLIM
jgi:hypothetical protein